MGDVNVTINGMPISVPRNTTILNAAAKLGIEIPTLCYLKYLVPDGSCRMCVVEVKGGRKKGLVTACSEHCSEGMIIETNSPHVINSRRFVLKMLLSNHEMKCITCTQNGHCKLQDYSFEYGVKEADFSGKRIQYDIDTSNPYIDFDPNLCIMCRRCEKVCMILQGRNTISIKGRGFDTQMSMVYDKPWSASNCESCGNCVQYCPVGALSNKAAKNTYRNWDVTKTSSTCGQCGTGCQVELLSKNNQIVEINAMDGPANRGLLCENGRYKALKMMQNKERLKEPLIKRNGVLEKASWEEAMDFIASRFSKIRKEYGSNSIAGLTGANATNEEYYLFQKMLRGAMGTNHIDNCTSQFTSFVHRTENTLGLGDMNSPIEVVLNYPEVILLMESYPLESNPVIGAHIRKAIINGTKLIVVNVNDSELDHKAHLKIKIKQGSANAFLLGVLAAVRDIGSVETSLNGYSPDKCASLCNIREEAFIEVAKCYANSENALILHSFSDENALENLKTLATSVNKFEKSGCGIYFLKKEPNIQGAYDMGCTPYYFTGCQEMEEQETVQKFEKVWNCKLNPKTGYNGVEILSNAAKGNIKGLYLYGEDLMNAQIQKERMSKALTNTDFVVVQQMYMSETAQFADVILPSLGYEYKEGTFTNTERRIQKIHSALPIEDTRITDTMIFCEIMRRMGMECNTASHAKIMDEITLLTSYLMDE